MLDMPHEDNDCEKVKLAKGIHRLKKAYEKFSGKTFDRSGFLNAFSHEDVDNQPYIGVLGVRVSGVLEKMIRDNIRMDVENLTCTGGRRLAVIREELEKGNVEKREMFRTFNMGIGFVLICDAENAEKIKAACAAMEQPVYQIGSVVAGEKKVVIDQTCEL